ncbi:MAG TPA: hypothetical protein VKS01_00760 [Bryobacteraceae bacterium]|nr:hypothetical protein [Bryobacteraceae bacterium]
MAVAFLGCLAVNADQKSRRTEIDVPYPVQVDQYVLQPGHYVIRLLDPAASTTLVQILSADEKTVVAALQGIPITRSQASEKTVFWFDNTPEGKPRIVRAWFYPGEETGIEVVPRTNKDR